MWQENFWTLFRKSFKLVRALWLDWLVNQSAVTWKLLSEILKADQCVQLITPELYLSRCQEDVCNSYSNEVAQETFCSYVRQGSESLDFRKIDWLFKNLTTSNPQSHYISKCRIIADDETLYNDWRSRFGCELSCESNEVYSQSFDPRDELCSSLSRLNQDLSR